MSLKILGSVRYGVKLSKKKRINVSTKSGIIMARKLSDLQDVDLSNAKDKYVLMYDDTDKKYKAYNPDDVLLASAISEETQPGLPQEFIDILNQILEPEAAEDALRALDQRIKELKLGDLANVDDIDKKDKYILMFNEILETYKAVNPDELLKASVEETTEPGLPEEFIDQLDVDLDNRIDYDGGEY